MKAKFSCLTAMLLLALGIGMLSASQASAQQTPVFEQLRMLFESGNMVSDAELVGWRTGRCYHADQPSIPWNGLLVGWQTQGPDHGPISTGTRILRTLPVYWANAGPGVFDDPSPQIQQGVERFLAREAPMVAGARYDERTTYGYYINRYDHEWAMRKVPADPGPGPNDGKGDGKGEPKLADNNRDPAPPPPPLPRVPNGRGGGQNPPPNTPEGPETPSSMDFIIARMSRNGMLVQYCYYFKQVR